ncbi:MAG: PAS domain-containing sensor histidine kinase, partial [Bacteroidota bacterium]|nr:PAS domain-containing sensor histidine kinase [Bacteroidota bacterium]
LHTTLSIILNSKFPMFLFWGKDQICFYNDAYRPSLGNNGKHPGILGMNGKDAWPEIWEFIKPIIDQVLSGGEASWNEDQLLPIYRNGKMEDVYWTFSYSPVIDETGKPSGVFVTCSETTEKVMNTERLKESNDQLAFAIDAAELGTYDFNPATNKFTANDRLKDWFGLKPGEMIELTNAINAIAENDRERVIKAIQESLNYSSGGIYDIEYTIINPVTHKKIIVKAKGRASFLEDKTAYRLSGTLQDVTATVKANKKIIESERNLRLIIHQAAVSIAIFRGPNHVVEIVNAKALELWGRKEEEVMKIPILEAMPELKNQGIQEMLDNVFTTGKSFIATELPLEIKRNGKIGKVYINFSYDPLYNEEGIIDGIIGVGVEVTEQVQARIDVENSVQRVRAIVESAPFPIGVYTGREMKIALANQSILDVWDKGSDVIGKLYTEILPELENQEIFEQLDSVYNSGIPFHTKNQQVDIITDNVKRTYYFNYNFTPLFDSDGLVYGVMNTAADVTDLVIANKKVEESEQLYRQTEERLRLAIEATELATWDLDLKSDKIVYSPRLSQIFGHDFFENLDHPFVRKQIHPEDDEVVQKAFEKALKTGNYQYEARIIKPDQNISWIKTQGKIFYNVDHEPIKLIGTVQDITEEKQYQRELEESEEKFRLLSESIPQFTWTSNRQGEITYFNDAVYTYSGLTPVALQEDFWKHIIHPDEIEETMFQWQNAIKHGRLFVMEHRFRRSDGEYRWQLSRALPQTDSEGNTQMWVGSSTDIQELKKQEEEKDFFISIASHELKTPITSIKAYIQLLLSKYEDNNDAFLTKSLINVDRQIVKLTTLISDMLDLSKIKSGNLYLHKENFILNKTITEVVEEISHINPAYKIAFSGAAEITVYGDRERIGQVLTNFLTNAVKYSPEATDIKVTSIKDNHKIIVSVEDTGIGINKNDQEKIFDRFYRVEGKNEKTFPGFGIGLFICQEIIHRHNGKTGVISEPGKGSLFYFTLPIENGSMQVEAMKDVLQM